MTATIETPLFDLDVPTTPAAKKAARAAAKKPFATREEWLVAAVLALAPLFEAVPDAAIPAMRVSVGWPGGRGNKANVIGQAWAKAAATDGIAQVFVSPVLDDATRVLDVLAHEMVHVIDGNASGHKGNFARIAKAIGLTGKMTATVAGEDLKAALAEIAADLGAYPHAALMPGAQGADGPKKQGTRMLKVSCERSGYVVRMTRKWLDEFGAPTCPCHGEVMVEAASAGE